LIAISSKERLTVLFNMLNSNKGNPEKPMWGRAFDTTTRKEVRVLLNNVLLKFQSAQKVRYVASI